MALKKPASKTAPKKAAAPSSKAAPAAKPAAAVATAAPATVTLKVIAAEFAAQHSVPKNQSETMLTDITSERIAAMVAHIMGLLVQHLKSGDRLRLGGLGILEVKNRPARTGRNPATGAPIEIKASKKIAFRAAKELKDAI